MKRLLLARIALTLVGFGVWGYGQRFDLANVRLAGIAVLGLSLLLRFAPKGWFE